MNGNKDIKGYLAPIIIVLMGVVLLFFGVKNKFSINDAKTLEQFFNGECKRGDYIYDTIDTTSFEYLEMTKVLKIIPYAKEHYFIIFNEDYTKCVSYKGSGSWNKHFDKNTGKCDKTVVIEGIIENMEYKVESPYMEAVNKLKAEGYIFMENKENINSGMGLYSTMQILAGISLIIIVIYASILLKKGRPGKIEKNIGLIAMIICLISILYVCLMQ